MEHIKLIYLLHNSGVNWHLVTPPSVLTVQFTPSVLLPVLSPFTLFSPYQTGIVWIVLRTAVTPMWWCCSVLCWYVEIRHSSAAGVFEHCVHSLSTLLDMPTLPPCRCKVGEEAQPLSTVCVGYLVLHQWYQDAAHKIHKGWIDLVGGLFLVQQWQWDV